MKRGVLIAIVVAILIVVALGLYFLFAGSNGFIGSNQANNSVPSVEGLTVEVLRQGSGVEAKAGDSVTVHYVGSLSNGEKFDSSIDRNAPFTFPLGQNRVIKGFDLGITGMKVGEKRKLTIAPELGYGSAGFLSIPANATLVYEVELLSINQ